MDNSSQMRCKHQSPFRQSICKWRIQNISYHSSVSEIHLNNLHLPDFYSPFNKDSITSFPGLLWLLTFVSLGSRCPIEIQNAAWLSSFNSWKASIKHFKYKSTTGLREDVVAMLCTYAYLMFTPWRHWLVGLIIWKSCFQEIEGFFIYWLICFALTFSFAFVQNQ